MIRTIIIDDEEKARGNLESILEDFCPEIEIVAMEDSVANALAAIAKTKPDLLLLDIQMQNETGFDLLEQLNDIDFEIIFITAFDNYALKAFKFSAVDYILKPIDIQELQLAVQRVAERKSDRNPTEKLELFVENLKPSSKRFNKIALPTSDGLIFVPLEDIVQCKSIDNYTEFHLVTKNRILVSKTIKFYEELLSDHQFIRVHRSHLINLEHIQRYVKGEGGYAIMSDGTEVMISRRKKETFLKQFNNL